MVIDDKSPEISTNLFIGYDIAAGYASSLLEYGLITQYILNNNSPPEYKVWTLYPIIHLVQRHFSANLNNYGLFIDYSTAYFYLECLLSLQKIHPTFMEDDDLPFKVVGLWKIV